MNNIYKFIYLILFLIYGCKSSNLDGGRITQRINSLDMNIYSNKGELIYSINSPKSYYDKVNHVFNLDKTTILLYKNRIQQYIINSESSKLSNNNKLLELNGNVEFRKTLEDKDILYADNFIWNIDEKTYLLTGNVKFENKSIMLSSDKASIDQNNVVEFFNPVKYIIKNKDNKNIYEVNSENAYYDINTRSVSFNSRDKRVRSKIFF